jgi:hypothetical protein
MPAHPFIAPDESYLIFDVAVSGYIRDLFICMRKPDGTWTKAINLGSPVNTYEGSEMCPFVSRDGKYFFFCRGGTEFWVDASFIERFRPAQTDSVSINVRSGWNIISVPIDSIYQKSDLFPAAITAALYYNPDSMIYLAKDTLERGMSYWLKFPYPSAMEVHGDSLFIDTFNVKQGWNMIGSISMPVPVNIIGSDPPGMITSDFFTYQSGYVVSDTIIPGSGYWVKVDQDGELILSSIGGTLLSRCIKIISTNEKPPPLPDEVATTDDNGLPSKFVLHQNYPNPFNLSTEIPFDISDQSFVRLEAFSVLGTLVKTLVEEVKGVGSYSVIWDGTDNLNKQVSSGLYTYKLTSGVFCRTRKALLLK